VYLRSTQALLKELGIKPEALLPGPNLEIDNEDSAWQANMFLAGRRKTVVLVHDKTRFIVVMHGLRKKDFQHFEAVVRSAIYDALFHSRLSPAIAEKYAEDIGPLSFGRTQNRSEVRYMNLPCAHVKSMINRGLANKCLIPQGKISVGYNRFNYKRGAHDSDDEQERRCSLIRMMDHIASLYPDAPIEYFDAIQLKARLQMYWAKGVKDITRTLVVPAGITFEELHKVLQFAFDWFDYHCYEFVLHDEKWETEIMHIADEPEGLRDDGPSELAENVTLISALTLSKNIFYHYDFGDNWKHFIDVERLFVGWGREGVVCIAGEGTTPPEDVGGEEGYARFLKIYKNPKRKEYEDTKNWAEYMQYREFDMDVLNEELKDVFAFYPKRVKRLRKAFGADEDDTGEGW